MRIDSRGRPLLHRTARDWSRHHRGDRLETRSILQPEAERAFTDAAREAVYACIALRRDVRHFQPGRAVDDAVLDRILGAAHQGPSVGFGQPWGFVLVRDRAVREEIRASFLRCREAEAVRFPPERRTAYLAHKLEGLLEAPLNVCVTVDLRDRGEAILGTTAQPEAVRASVCCATENLWLAARAEGIGVGWVSIVEPAVLRTQLDLPAGVEPVAYLCIGHPVAFRSRPMLEETGWKARRPLADVVHRNGRWEEPNGAPARDAPPAPRDPRGAIPLPSAAAREASARYSTTLTKPVGSLGALEELAAWYAGVRGTFPPPRLTCAALALFAADHGVVSEGVSAYGSTLTASMVANVMSGGAAINALAAEMGVSITLVDVGIAGDLSAAPQHGPVALRRRPVRAGTANMRVQPAMRRDEAEAAMEVGADVARELHRTGAQAIALGEIGIGNTTSAAALTSVLTGHAPRAVAGPGTGVSAAIVQRKISVIEAALALHQPDPSDPVAVLAAIGGLEIAAMAGCALGAARLRLPVVLDGFVSHAAALVATHLDARVRDSMLAAHASTEPGAAYALAHLRLTPLMSLGMRLGEGTGAVLGVGLLRAAVLAQLSMATFATAGVAGRAGIPETDRR